LADHAGKSEAALSQFVSDVYEAAALKAEIVFAYFAVSRIRVKPSSPQCREVKAPHGLRDKAHLSMQGAPQNCAPVRHPPG
jgi:hypothetical protein